MSTQANPETTDVEAAARDRASARLNFFLTTSLKVEPNGVLGARVRNLSAGGMMVEFAEEPDPELEIGQRLVAELRNIGKLKGAVAWCVGKRIGIRFDREVDPELARKPSGGGEATPDFIKPVLVPGRSLKYVEGLQGR